MSNFGKAASKITSPGLFPGSGMQANKELWIKSRKFIAGFSLRFQYQRLVVIQKILARAEKIRGGRHPADFVQEFFAHTFADEVHELFHPLHLRGFLHAGRDFVFPQLADVSQHVAARRQFYLFATKLLADLLEQPRIADAAATNHQSARAGFRQQRLRLRYTVDVAVGQHRTAQLAHRPRNQVVTHAGPVHLHDGARVDGQQVNRMFREQWQQRVELGGRLETDARLHRERNCDRVAQRAEDGVDFLRFAQQASPGTFAINDRRRAAEVQLNRGNGVTLQFLRRADERGDVVADELCNNRATGRVFGDGIENPFLRARIAVDAEVFRPTNIRPAVACQHAPELERGHVLHRREREDGRRAVKQVQKCFGRSHAERKSAAGTH